jgi:translocation and assembly module TamB
LTDTPPPHETGADVADTPAEKAKRKRTRLQLAAFVAGVTFAGLLALIVVALVGGRMYLLSDAGRELITSFVAGKKSAATAGSTSRDFKAICSTTSV